jgi:hypothetical protein
MIFLSHKTLTIKLLMLFLVSCGLFGKLNAQVKTMGLTKKINGNDENGYVLFTPMGTDTTFLINKCGQRVHAWRSEYTPGLSVYLKPNGNLLKTGTYSDTSFGDAGGRGGIVEEFDWDNNLVWRYKIFNDSLCQHHDITPLPNGNVLVLAWHAISRSRAVDLGRLPTNFAPGQTELWAERIIELKPIGKDSAAIVWQWDVYDHIVQDVDVSKPNYGTVSSNPGRMNINYALNMYTADWLHMNGLDYNEELDQIIMSVHNASEIWIIDHSTTTQEARTRQGGQHNKGGDLLYRWGNAEAYNSGTPTDRKLFRQHNAHWIPNGFKDSGCIMIFNNGWNRDTSYSSIDVIKTPVLANGSYVSSLPYGPSRPFLIYKDSIPTNFFSQVISGAQRLPNGNTLICSGIQGRFFEVTPAGKTVWEYINPVGQGFVQADGDKSYLNKVFRCTFYASDYSAFKNRTLKPGLPIEKSPYPYSCIYETVPPKVVSVSPGLNQVNVNTKRILELKFDESVIKRGGNITIYQNKTVYENIAVHSDMVKINNNIVTIEHKPFPLNSRISVKVLANNFRDSSNNVMVKNVDTSEWSFNTKVREISVVSLSPAHLSNNIVPDAKLELTFSETALKAGSAGFTIFENGAVKEIISVNDAAVTLNNDKVIITPSSPFALDAFIVVVMDSCFSDVTGYKVNAIPYNNWYFRTVSGPKKVALSPELNAVDVSVTATMNIQFDKKVSIKNQGNIQVFENGIIKENIALASELLNADGTTLSFATQNAFAPSSRVAVVIPDGLLSDSVGYAFKGIDSADWHFTVLKKTTGIYSSKLDPANLKVYPNPGNGTFTLKMDKPFAFAELFDMTGKKMVLNIQAGSGLTQIECPGISAGHYLLLVNGLYTVMIEVN